jgi:hypothetical protein
MRGPGPSATHAPKRGGDPGQGDRRYVLTLVPLPGTDPIRSLRWILKSALRQHHMRCTDIHEESGDSHKGSMGASKKGLGASQP